MLTAVQSCVNTLELRNMLHPFRDGMLSQARPFAEIAQFLKSELEELAQRRAADDFDIAPS
jgi:adenylate cyclase